MTVNLPRPGAQYQPGEEAQNRRLITQALERIDVKAGQLVFPTSQVAPSNPVQGQGYYDQTTSLAYVWTGSVWEALPGGGGGVTVTGTPVAGELTFWSSASAITNGNLSGDGTTANTGVLTVTKTSGVAFGYFATGTDASHLTGTISVNRFNSGTSASSSTFLRGDGTWVTPTAGSGTVTSVDLSMPAIFTVSNNPVTTSGTLTVTLATETANLIWAGPTTGAAATPTFRAMVAADLPATAVTPGSYTNTNLTVDAAGRITAASTGSGGTGTVTSVALSLPSFITVSGSPVTTTGTLTGTLATQSANLIFAGPTTGIAAAPTFRAMVAADIPNTAVSAGSYTSTNLTVDAQGRITAASSGSGGLTIGGSNTQVQYNNSSALGGSSGITLTATQATLVAPILGTPASGTLTNCTGLPVAGGGTGVATLAAHGVVIGNGASPVNVTGAGTSGQIFISNGASADPTFQTLAYVSSIYNQWFGDGSDSSLSISSGTTTLTRDMYYTTLTISGTATLNTAGFRIFCSVNLDLSNAPASAIKFWNGGNTLNGGNSALNGAGAQGVQASATAGTSGGGANATTTSPAGGTGAGTQATANAAASGSYSLGVSGSGGAGGAVGATAGGAARTGITATSAIDIRYAIQNFATWTAAGSWALIKGGISAPGGSSGAGDGVGSGGGGGGGGGAAGVIQIFAATITRGASTAAGAITVKGGNGGAGGPGTGGTNRGGGGGGGGAAGGLAIIFYGALAGATGTNMIDASGGDGGAGANGTGTGLGGDGGGAGGQGGADLYNMTAGTQSNNRGAVAMVAGNGHSSGTGGAAQTNTFRVSL